MTKTDGRMPKRIALWPLSKIVPYPENPRDHTDEEIRRLAEFVVRVGFLSPIEVDEAGVILAGHRRLAAAALLGMKSAPVIQHGHLAEDEKRAYRIADNRLTIEGEWNRSHLKSEATALRAAGWDLQGIGFSDSEVRAMLDGLPDVAPPAVEESKYEDEIPDAPKHPTTRVGDVWRLADHRIMCADSLREENRTRLLGIGTKSAERVDCVFTDPPYAIYGSSTGIASDITDDKMVRPFFREVFLACVATCRPFAHIYVCCDWRSYPSWWEVAKATGIFPKNMIVWDKGGAGLGANYANTHELMMFAWLIPLRRGMSQKITGGRQVNDANVWRANRVPAAGNKGGREHNAQKPLEIVLRAIENSTEPGELVLDMFLGSGTTLVAAAKLGRRCAAFEIEPRYCDVAVLRWQNDTGMSATLDGTKKTFDQVRAERAKASR